MKNSFYFLREMNDPRSAMDSKADEPRDFEPERSAGYYWAIPPIILCVVALLQLLAVHFFQLDRWEGGGFGMFASSDRGSHRFVRIMVPTVQGDIKAFPADWRTSKLKMVTLPVKSLLNKEALGHESTQWAVFKPGISELKLDNHAPVLADVEKWYGSGPLNMDLYPTLLVPADYLAGDVERITPTGQIELEVYRLVNRGNGRFGSGLLISTKGK
jgi:hypothetical protein